jgi:hypothetical protein
LTNFECEAMAGNGNQVNLQKLASKFQKVSEIKGTYFWRVLAV